MKTMQELNHEYAEIIKQNYDENVQSAQKAVEYMRQSTAVYHGEPIACLYMPKFFSQADFNFIEKAVANTIYGILEKVIQRYFDDAEYRKLFPFDEELERLILAESGYKTLLPIARLDIFFNEENSSFKFCEFNADGASAMNEGRELDKALSNSHAFLEMQKRYNIKTFELFDSWVAEFAEIYSQYNNKVDNPRIIITDFMDLSTPNEFIEFKKAFKKAGFNTEIAEIRELTYKDGILRTLDGEKVDAIYRRAVTRDIIEHKSEVQPFLQAAHDNAVCIIGHFRTQIIHNKAIFMILHKPETMAFLTLEEQEYVLEHIPKTEPLTAESIKSHNLAENKDLYIIKPQDLYASQGVYAGADLSTEDWQNMLQSALDKDYLLQEYYPPYKTQNLNFNKLSEPPKNPNFETYNNITGMFMYNGKLKGLYSRAGQKATISYSAGGLTMASMVATEK
ncbi:MAG: glutathionylspermidine synthase family protein [Firmicutes bacterium]|nr:glutathionylspermidine synthase family protein [Bacillota bacterium]